MLQIPVSMDKLTVEYTDVHIEFFIEYVTRQLKQNYYVKLEKGESQAFVFTVKVNRGSKWKLHMSYQHIQHGLSLSNCYSLWLKIHPDHLHAFTDVFKTLRENSSKVNFVRGEIAFDIPRHLNDVLLIPKRKRNVRYVVDTTYYGFEQQSKNGYCRFYDKKKQLKDRKNIEIDGERSRVEIKWFPKYENCFLLSELSDERTPDFNKMYQCFVITDRVSLTPRFKGIVDALTRRMASIFDYESNDRRRLRKALTSQTEVDFNALLEQQWKTLVEPFVSQILID